MRALCALICLVSIFNQQATASQLKLQEVVSNIDTPWAVTAIDPTHLLITLRKGNLLLVSGLDSTIMVKSITFTPDDLLFAGQGGVLDIKAHPQYTQNRWLYVSYSAGTHDANFLKVQRITLDVTSEDPQIEDTKDIFRLVDEKATAAHFGGRLAFDQTGNLLITSGEGFDYREKAQLPHSHLGKILRITPDGDAVVDNPFFTTQEDPSSYVYSYGHRNPQGLIVLEDGTILSNEHGPDGGDEINVIEAGNNYGWPVITLGKDYIGATISPFTEYPGMQQPAVNWTPSIAPSSMIFYSGDRFASLANHFLITSLKYKQLHVLSRDLSSETIIFNEYERRLRDIAQTDSGSIYILSDGNDAVLYKIVY